MKVKAKNSTSKVQQNKIKNKSSAKGFMKKKRNEQNIHSMRLSFGIIYLGSLFKQQLKKRSNTYMMLFSHKSDNITIIFLQDVLLTTDFASRYS